jgi:DNA-binding LytR/AlgR family response regulator
LATEVIRLDDKGLSPAVDVLPQASTVPAKPPRIAIKTRGKILFIDPAQVVAIEAQGNYVLLHRLTGSDTFRGSISTVGEKLRPYGFARIHRSLLVNTSFVEELQSRATGAYVLRIKGGKEFAVSRTYKRNLHSITPLWFGSDRFDAD